jgi:hypothetical protein
MLARCSGQELHLATEYSSAGDGELGQNGQGVFQQLLLIPSIFSFFLFFHFPHPIHLVFDGS